MVAITDTGTYEVEFAPNGNDLEIKKVCINCEYAGEPADFPTCDECNGESNFILRERE